MPGRMDIYTLLIVVAFVALAIGIGFVWYRSGVLFDTASPFEVISTAAASLPTHHLPSAMLG